MKITFLGAAGEVTGSQHLIETRKLRILFDCGMFQGPRAEARRKNQHFHCQPKDLDAVILSHAHMDHCGLLPRLYAKGFRGPIFCTDATADIAEIMLLDSAKIQVEDAKYLARKLKVDRSAIEPLYDQQDVEHVMRKFEPIHFHKWEDLGHGVIVRFLPAGHILGSAIVELIIRDQGEERKIVFSGDLGRRGMPLLVDPEPVMGADVLICESTYGNRIHPQAKDMKQELLRIVHRTIQQGGRLIVPAFSLGRTQQIVYFLNELFHDGQLPKIPIFVDSPLATRLTRIFRRYDETLDEDVQSSIRAGDRDVFGFQTLTYVGSQQQSIALNDHQGPCMIISASGMCEGGRVVHHLKHSVSDERNTICLMGYQAPHTLGRQIAERRSTVRIFDREIPLRAHVEQLNGLSAHADVTDFKWWFEESTKTGHSFRKVFLVHGEPESAAALSQTIADYCDEPPVIPEQYESLEIE